MAIITYPLNNIEYAAEDAELYNSTRTSGVFAMDDFDFSVTGADNNITIGEGMAWIRNSKFSGKAVANKSVETLDLGVADASFPRIDVVALQFDKTGNATSLVVKQGAASSSPAIPAIVQTEVLYELYLYAVYRGAGAATVQEADVNDLRGDVNYCGLMRDGVTRDQAVPDGSVTTAKFSADAKAPFAAQADVALNGVVALTAAKSGTTFSLSGLGNRSGVVPCVFSAPAIYNVGDTFVIDGVSYAAAEQNGESLAAKTFASGASVSCVVNTAARTINFKSSGGSLKYAIGSAKCDASTLYNVLTVSGLAFKPFMAMAYRNASSIDSEQIAEPSFVALDDTGNKLIGIRGSNSAYDDFHHDSKQQLTENGFTLRMGLNDYDPGEDSYAWTVTWIAWGF